LRESTLCDQRLDGGRIKKLLPERVSYGQPIQGQKGTRHAFAVIIGTVEVSHG
jgi:hypothetical protein